MTPTAPDPYRLLGLAPDASDEALRHAYHERLRRDGVSPELNAAWTLVRDPAARERHRWTAIDSLIHLPPEEQQDPIPPDLDAIIIELASASDWELGARA